MFRILFDDMQTTNSFDKHCKEFFNEIMKSFNEFSGFEEKEEEKKKEDVKEEETPSHSYFHKVSDCFEDGKHVSHAEKEVKDGKVIKDIDEKPTASIEGTKEECSCKDKECICEKENKKLNKWLTSAENALCEKDEQISTLKNEINALKKENSSLKEKLTIVKNFLGK